MSFSPSFYDERFIPAPMFFAEEDRREWIQRSLQPQPPQINIFYGTTTVIQYANSSEASQRQERQPECPQHPSQPSNFGGNQNRLGLIGRSRIPVPGPGAMSSCNVGQVNNNRSLYPNRLQSRRNAGQATTRIYDTEAARQQHEKDSYTTSSVFF